MSNPCHMCKHFSLRPGSEDWGRCTRYPSPQPEKSGFDRCGECEVVYHRAEDKRKPLSKSDKEKLYYGWFFIPYHNSKNGVQVRAHNKRDAGNKVKKYSMEFEALSDKKFRFWRTKEVVVLEFALPWEYKMTYIGEDIYTIEKLEKVKSSHHQ